MYPVHMLTPCSYWPCPSPRKRQACRPGRDRRCSRSGPRRDPFPETKTVGRVRPAFRLRPDLASRRAATPCRRMRSRWWRGCAKKAEVRERQSSTSRRVWPITTLNGEHQDGAGQSRAVARRDPGAKKSRSSGTELADRKAEAGVDSKRNWSGARPCRADDASPEYRYDRHLFPLPDARSANCPLPAAMLAKPATARLPDDDADTGGQPADHAGRTTT